VDYCQINRHFGGKKFQNKKKIEKIDLDYVERERERKKIVKEKPDGRKEVRK
jgi:urease accessory protein UreE